MKNINQVVDLHRRISGGYFDVMREYGLIEHQPDTLIPQEDNSLLFTNSTVVPLKGKLLSGDYLGNGYFLCQDCLRLKTLKTITDMKTPIKYVSCFKMVGSIAPSNCLDLSVDSSLEFLLKVVGIARQDLLIWTHEGTEGDWEKIYSAKGLSVEKKYPYSWKYGMSGVYGSGVTFARRYPDGSSTSIGNLVAMSVDDQPLAYEFGFGIEPLIGKGMLCETAFSGSMQFAITGLPVNDVNFRIANLLGIVTAMSMAGVNKKECRSRWFLFTQTVRLLVSLSIANGVEFDQLTFWIEGFSKHFFRKDVSVQLLEYLQGRWEEIATSEARFMSWLKSQQGLYRQKGKGVLRFTTAEEVVDYAEKTFSIPKERVFEMLFLFEPWASEKGQGC